MAVEKEMKNAAAALGAQVKKKGENPYQQALNEVISEEFIPQNAMGMSDAMLEGIYGEAYRLYNTGKYASAAEMFRFLVMVKPIEPKFAMGLAACFHMMKQYRQAITAYTMCGVIDPDSPIPHYHASDCYIQLKDTMSAIIALEMAIKRAGVKPEYQALKDRALLSIQSLKKESGKEQDLKKEIKEKHKKK
jgi:type III secretion system low calcium response chaperone LcrH/SycD